MRKNTSFSALLLLFALLLLWQLGAMGMDAAYILPSPVQVLVRLWQLRVPLFTAHLPATLLCTGIGLVISIVLGLLLAVLIALDLHVDLLARLCLCYGLVIPYGARYW